MKNKEKLTEKTLSAYCLGCPDYIKGVLGCEGECENSIIFEAGRKAGIAEYKADIPIKFQPWPKAYTAGRKAEHLDFLSTVQQYCRTKCPYDTDDCPCGLVGVVFEYTSKKMLKKLIKE